MLWGFDGYYSEIWTKVHQAGGTLSLSAHAARDPCWAGKAGRRADRALSGLVDDKVAIATGTVPGRDAMVQVLVLPVTLATGVVVIGLIFAMGL